MRTLALLVVAWCVVLSACGQDPAPSPGIYDLPGAGGSGGSASGFCVNYCNYVVANGSGCETYNDGSRCAKNCSTYSTGPCPSQWQQYANCAMKTSVSCEMSDVGKLALETQGCNTEFNAFLTCLADHDGGLCP